MFTFDHIAMAVTDLERSIAFYTALGFSLVEQFITKQDKWCVLALNDIVLELFETKEMAISSSHFAFATKDVGKAKEWIEKLTKQKLTIYDGDLQRASFHFADPDENDIQIIAKQRVKRRG